MCTKRLELNILLIEVPEISNRGIVRGTWICGVPGVTYVGGSRLLYSAPLEVSYSCSSTVANPYFRGDGGGGGGESPPDRRLAYV